MNPSTYAPSPQSQTRWPADSFVWWRSLIVIAALLGATLVGLLLAAVVLIAQAGGKVAMIHSAPVGWLLGSQLVAYIPLIAVALVILPWLARAPLAAIGFRTPNAGDIVWGAGGAIAMTIVTSAVGGIESTVLHQRVDETAVDLMLKAHGLAAFEFAFLAIIAAPFVEELIFRGFVFNALLRYLTPWIAIVAGGMVFGAVHYDGHSAGAVVPLMCGGMVLCAVYYYRRVLWSDMIAHALFNLVPVALVFVFHQKVT